jgi:small-conductance mechanosensitive channel
MMNTTFLEGTESEQNSTISSSGWNIDSPEPPAGDNYSEDVSSFVHWVKDPEEMLSPWHHNPLFTTILTTYSATFVFGLLFNVLAIAAVVFDNKGSTSNPNPSGPTGGGGRSVFLISTLTADVVLLAVGAPLQTAAYFVVNFDEEGIICKSATFVELVAAVAVVMNLTAVSLERYKYLIRVIPVLITISLLKSLSLVVRLFICINPLLYGIRKALCGHAY